MDPDGLSSSEHMGGQLGQPGREAGTAAGHAGMPDRRAGAYPSTPKVGPLALAALPPPFIYVADAHVSCVLGEPRPPGRMLPWRRLLCSRVRGIAGRERGRVARAPHVDGAGPGSDGLYCPEGACC